VRGRYAGILVAGFAALAAVLAAGVGAASAVTAVTWTVHPGGPVSLKSGRFTLTDTKTGVTITCRSTRMRGTLRGGSGLRGTGIGSIASVNLTECGDPPTTPGMTAAGLPWHMNLTSYNATKRVVTGSLSHVQVKIKGPGCSAVVNGTGATAADGMVTFRYADGTGALTVLTTGGNLHLYHVKGCFGLLNNADPVTLSATYTLSPAQTITSP
jgi:hypothetical protein